MKGFTLTKIELQMLRVAHRRAKREDAKAAYKINAIILLGTGWTIEAVREALLLDDETIRRYVQLFREGGVDKLLETNHQGSGGKLSDDEISELCEELDSHIYLTTQSICEHVEKRFGVVYSIGGMRDLLHRLNYGYKKPKLVPANPDKGMQEFFSGRIPALYGE